jgi:hypothetical protein
MKNKIHLNAYMGNRPRRMGDTITQTGKLTDEVQVKNESEIDRLGEIRTWNSKET